jgi:GTP-binding protein Era
MAGFHFGVIAILGKPNAGKSTLVNSLLGERIAAVSPRPQTTRRRQLGILTRPGSQMIFVDTPGIHAPRHKLGEFLNQEAEEALDGVDVVLFLLDASHGPGDEDERIAWLLAGLKQKPKIVLGMNKCDLVTEELLNQRMETCRRLAAGAPVFPISAATGQGLLDLLEALENMLPHGEAEYPSDQLTDLYEREIAADLIRAAALNALRDEVPHGVNVRIDEFKERGETGAYIHATLFVERESQKGILIGEGGRMLKRIGTTARQEIEAMSGRQVYLELRAKVEKDWRNREDVLRRFGYALKKRRRK